MGDSLGIVHCFADCIARDGVSQDTGFFDLFRPDKLIHLFIFAVFVFLQIKSFLRQPVFLFFRQYAVITTLLIGLSLALGTELLQSFYIPMRHGSVYDFIANATGCFIGWGFANKLKIKN
ncbi:MAG: VanZ family protein [Bacteroidetes bacterium]|nr:VanZ family protein [Bacteroidota bacterium]